MSNAGDVSGDGLGDLLIGADRADPNGGYSGASYVVFGRNTGQTGPFPASLNLADLDGTNGFRLHGVAAFDYSGFAVSSAGDVNGDGLADLLIGASRADPNGGDSGASYVVFGVYRADPNGVDSGASYVVFGGPPPPPVEAALTNPASRSLAPDPHAMSALVCNLAESSGTPCANRIRLFVSRSAVRLGDEASDKAPGRLRLAAGVTSIPPGPNGIVRLKVTRQGKRIVGTTTKRRLRGVIEIKNTAGTAISSTRITIKLRKRP